MRYTIQFSSGNTLDISEGDFNAILESGAQGRGLLADADKKIIAWINLHNIDYITPKEETASGISSMPKPEDIREEKQKERERIKGDPNAVLARIRQKHENE